MAEPEKACAFDVFGAAGIEAAARALMDLRDSCDDWCADAYHVLSAAVDALNAGALIDRTALVLAGWDGDEQDYATNAGQVRDYHCERAEELLGVVGLLPERGGAT